MRGPTGWRVAVRIAARDARRWKGRSVLVLAMIALPVLAVTATDVVVATTTVSGAEAPERRVGAADAKVSFVGGDVAQRPDPEREGATWGSPRDEGRGWDPGPAEVEAALGRPVESVELRELSLRVVTDAGVTGLPVWETDLRSPLTAGLFTVAEGRAPATPGEAVVTAALAERGPGIGERLEVVDGNTLDVVGIIEDATHRDAETAVALPGGFGVDPPRDMGGNAGTWLVEAGGVDWDDVLALNDAGALVVSRQVLADPPPESAVAPEMRGMSDSPIDEATVQILALIVVMALIEVVLLAGPAFAVGARRQQRTLALVAATGGTPRQMRRVILASGLVLGGVAAVLGVLLGLLVAWAVLPLVQRFSGEWLGPFDVPWLHVAGIAAFGLVSALLAAVVPAWIASRQDVVAVLAGRRGDRRPTLRSPLLGVVLLVVGVAAAVSGARGGGEIQIAASAIPTVLGMVLVVPVVLVGVASLARLLPLSLRYAVRDAARHRTRTVPAVAAVAATVAGVVALGIGAASDEKENRETYPPSLAMGDGALTWTPPEDGRASATWRRLVDAAADRAPDHPTQVVRGVPYGTPDGGFTDVYFRAGGEEVWAEHYSAFGTSVLVADEVPDLDLGVPRAQRAAAEETLAAGGALVFTSRRSVAGEEVSVRAETWSASGDRAARSPRVRVPAELVPVDGRARVQAVLSPEAARAVGVEAAPTGLLVRGPLDRATERDLEEAAQAISAGASFTVERGYQPDDEYVIVLLVLGALGAVLMLGGTLTATFLALSDARPDLATLAAVGAAPRTRRGVAAAYALVVGLVGAVLGTLVGMVPGIAVSVPLTRGGGGPGAPYLDIPWLLVAGVVVGVPLLTALVVGATARSRLPMVARLD